VPRLAQVKKVEGDEEKLVAGLEDRETMGHWASQKIEKNELHAYQKVWNHDSLDGLTGMKVARRDAGEKLWWTDLQAWLRRMRGQSDAVAFGFVLAVLMYLIALLVQTQLF
jgi:hypothetical protein